MKDRRIKERRGWDGKPRCEPGVDTWFEERRETIIKAGRRSGIDRRSPGRMSDYQTRALGFDEKKLRGEGK